MNYCKIYLSIIVFSSISRLFIVSVFVMSNREYLMYSVISFLLMTIFSLVLFTIAYYLLASSKQLITSLLLCYLHN